MRFHLFKVILATVLSLVVFSVSQSALASDTIKVGFIASLSGPAAALGIPYNKGIKTGIAYQSSIAGHDIQVITLDARSNPNQAAWAARKLINKYHVDALIGASTSVGTQAVAQIAAKTKTPLLGLSPIKPSKSAQKWVVIIPQPPSLMFEPLIKRMSTHGVETVGYIGYNDTWGDIVYNATKKFAKEYGINVVASERYARSATSVTGQALKVMAQNPDAVMTGGSGATGALPYLALANMGYSGKLYGPYPVVDPAFVDVVGSAGNGLIVTTGPVVVASQLPEDYPTRTIGLKYKSLFQNVNGGPPKSAFAAYSFDAWLVFLDAAKRASAEAEPGTAAFRAALRDALKHTHEVVGTTGVYNFKPGELYGLDKRSVVFAQLKDGHWNFLGLGTNNY